MQELEAFRTVYAAYESAKLAYDVKVNAYNAAITKNMAATKAPAGYEWLNFLVAPTLVPSRPCKPDTPPAYAGPKLFASGEVAYSAAVTAATWSTTNAVYLRNLPTTSLNGGAATTINTAFYGTPNPKQLIKTGFLQASANIASFTSDDIANVGHVFGRLGQGVRSVPATGILAFTTDFATQSEHGMMWSILPINPGDTTGLAASKTIDFVASVS